jgi:hypothetical protein
LALPGKYLVKFGRIGRKMQRLLVWLIIIAFIALAGCDRARSRFDEVRLGMTRVEVMKILGEPQEKQTRDMETGTGEVLRWRFGDQTIVLLFKKDRVSGRQLAGS